LRERVSDIVAIERLNQRVEVSYGESGVLIADDSEWRWRPESQAGSAVSVTEGILDETGAGSSSEERTIRLVSRRKPSGAKLLTDLHVQAARSSGRLTEVP
jgi:hypothetical protein